MKLPQCDREQEVVDALRSGRWRGAWGEEIRQHAANCAVCAEVALAAELFQCEADRARNELGPPGAGLPSAGLVWWKAQLAARREAERRAAAPVEFVAHLAYAVGAVAAVLLGVRHWPRLAQWLQPAAGLYAYSPLGGRRRSLPRRTAGSIGSRTLGPAKPPFSCLPLAPRCLPSYSLPHVSPGAKTRSGIADLISARG